MKIGEAIYGSQAQADAAADADMAGGAPGGGAKGGSGDKVVDADFEEVKDDKKSA
jgi:molecular chaperone DnaK